MAELITTPGVYPDVAAEDYHGREICDAPSISATGLKTIITRSPRHYWWTSALNPDRPEQEAKRHFAVGKAAHDMLLLTDRWPHHYHVLPEGFSRAAKVAQADAIAAANDAEAAGKTLLSANDAVMVKALAASIQAHDLAPSLLCNGDPEVTLAWKDPETGVWLRTRPDFLPRPKRYIPDVKTAADGSPAAFRRAVQAHGYHIAAAHYLNGIEALFGPTPEPRRFIFVVVEKEAPYVVTLYQLDEGDIERGRMLVRSAINTFAGCLDSGKWPGYAPLDAQGDETVLPIDLPGWAAREVDAAVERGELSYT